MSFTMFYHVHWLWILLCWLASVFVIGLNSKEWSVPSPLDSPLPVEIVVYFKSIKLLLSDQRICMCCWPSWPLSKLRETSLSRWTSSGGTNADNHGLPFLSDHLHLRHDHLPLPLLRLLLARATQVDRGAEEGACKAGEWYDVANHFLKSTYTEFPIVNV